MSRWATNPITSSRDEATTSASTDGRRGSKQAGPLFSRRGLGYLTPFFLSAAFFLSGFFTLFAPMPMLLLRLARGRALACAAAATNLAIVWLAGGALNAFAFAVLGIVVAFALAEFISRKFSLESMVAGTMAAMALVTMLVIGALAARSPGGLRAGFVEQVDGRVRQAVELVLTASQSASRDGSQPAEAPAAEEIDAMRANVVQSLPSAAAIFALVLVVANAILSLRLNPRGIRRGLELKPDFLRVWRAPEALVWPTLAAGAASLWLEGAAGIVATGVLRFLLAIYCFQGLSVLAFFFEAWGLRPLFRWLGWACAVFFMMPFVLSLGFFDLWFNFRSRFRPAGN